MVLKFVGAYITLDLPLILFVLTSGIYSFFYTRQVALPCSVTWLTVFSSSRRWGYHVLAANLHRNLRSHSSRHMYPIPQP
ncbi:hypothetical protein BDV12DRAFT_173305 [Aspergillus spectabilis]